MNDEIFELCKRHSFSTIYFELGDSIAMKYQSLVSNILNYNNINNGFKEEIVYKERLKLFRVFYKEYKLVIGPDAGIEQQISDLMIEISNKFPNFKWGSIEK